MAISHLYPNQRPTLNLNFTRSKTLDPRITFTRDSTATYVDSNGLIKTAADNEARFDHDPATGECLGLLIEEARTNSITYSFDLGNTGTGGWYTNANKGGLNGSSNKNYFVTQSNTTDTLAPDGTYTATKLSAPGTIINPQATPTISELSYAIHLVSKVTAPAGVSSFYIKDPSNFANGLNKIGIMAGGFFNPSKGYASFDLVNNQVNTANTASDAKIEDVGNGWYRISCVTGEGGPWGFNAWNALTSDLYVWGAQCESGGSFPTSYIPTSGSTYQRKADEITLTNSGIFNSNENTIINHDFGVAGAGTSLTIVGNGEVANRTAVYNSNLTQEQINTLTGTDEWWEWRVLGDTFGLNNFVTDGQVTVDWGDGTVEVLTQSDHTFTNGGGYHTIRFRLDSGTYFRPYVFNDATHKDKVISVGPCPNSMTVNMYRAFYGCTNLETFDSRIVHGGSLNMSTAWRECSSLLNVPFVDTSGTTNLSQAWSTCSSLTSFPLIDTSSCENFNDAWYNCTSLESFPLIDTSNGTNFNNTWYGCTGLTSFPLIDTSNGTSFSNTWSYCASIVSFPDLDLSNGNAFGYCWRECNNMSTFLPTDFSSGTNFQQGWNASGVTAFQNGLTFVDATNFNQCWANSGSLVTFPPNAFDSWTGTPANGCFVSAWNNCGSLSATSVENILNSIDASGQSAPSSSVDITISYQIASGTPNISTAVTNLKNRNWTITLNGVAQ